MNWIVYKLTWGFLNVNNWYWIDRGKVPIDWV